MPLIKLKNLSFSYPLCETRALSNVSLSVERSEFILLCGPSGCGKTTLLRSLKPEISPHGDYTGSILYREKPIDMLSPYESASEIGFVFQNPENQIVTDTVWHELSFGLENLGVTTSEIRRRVAETALFFGIDEWFGKSVFALSGGEKQILNLAAVIAMQPSMVVLDEPTSQLDPIAAKNFITLLKRIHDELGITVVISEHRIEELLPMVDRVILMTDAKIEYEGTPEQFTGYVISNPGHSFTKALTSAARIYAGVSPELRMHTACPITPRDGRRWMETAVAGRTAAESVNEPLCKQPNFLGVQDVWYRYESGGAYVLKGLSLEVGRGTIHAVLGGNGSGKTTLLRILAGIAMQNRGAVRVEGQKLPSLRERRKSRHSIGLLSQNPKMMFSCDTLREELMEAVALCEADEQTALNIAQELDILPLLERHPYDLSGGEQQRAALAKLLLFSHDILLLDEPTKGLDRFAKDKLGRMLTELSNKGCTILLVTHDVEFAAEFTHRTSMLFEGAVICSELSRQFFLRNNFFTTAASRMTRGLIDQVVLCEDAIHALNLL